MPSLLGRVALLTCTQNLKRIEVIEDEESEIIEAVKRMSDRYDFVVTRYVPHASVVREMGGTDNTCSGGIGPTYDPSSWVTLAIQLTRWQTRRYHVPVYLEGVWATSHSPPGCIRAHEEDIETAPVPAEL